MPPDDGCDGCTRSMTSMTQPMSPGPPMTQVSGVIAQPTPYVSRSRIYAFVVDETGMPIELGSGRFAKAYLGEERWVESQDHAAPPGRDQVPAARRHRRRPDAVPDGEGDPGARPGSPEHRRAARARAKATAPGFIPPSIRDKVENDFMILELLDMSLEERLKGARQKRRRDDLLAVPLRERIFRVLEYIIPVATAVEFAHLVRDTCHRDIKPANILVKLPDPNLRGSQMKIKLADFNVGKVADADLDVSMTRFQAVPGTLYFQSPEQETNTFELLVNVHAGLARGRVLRGLLHRHLRERHVLAVQPQRALLDRGRGSHAQEDPAQPPVRRAERDQRARPRREERRSPGRHLLARRGVLLPDLRRVREPEEPVRRVPQVRRVRAARREQLDRRVHRARVPDDPEHARAEGRRPGRPRARARGSVLQLQALPRRQRRADRSGRS